MGTYGFIRFAMPMFPEATFRALPLIVALSLIGIIYGACVAMVQQDVKKLVAYSSVSHLGFVMLGLFALNTHAVEGAILGMINHGVSTGALFLLVGVIYERRHTRMISEYGGLTRVMPVYATVFMIVTLSSIGLPPLNGFVHEFLILVGAFQVNAWWGILAATGVVLGAIYMLWMLQRVFFGEVTNEKNLGLKDLTPREVLVFLPILVMIFWMGVYSKPFVSRMEPAVTQFVEQMTSVRQAAGGRAGPVGQQPAAGSPFAPSHSVARPGGPPLAATRADRHNAASAGGADGGPPPRAGDEHGGGNRLQDPRERAGTDTGGGR
jgi:NADH-quinone oxidoreductase subunit M